MSGDQHSLLHRHLHRLVLPIFSVDSGVKKKMTACRSTLSEREEARIESEKTEFKWRWVLLVGEVKEVEDGKNIERDHYKMPIRLAELPERHVKIWTETTKLVEVIYSDYGFSLLILF